eukprot:6172809-Pleurochrysis_carterae.AAC.1
MLQWNSDNVLLLTEHWNRIIMPRLIARDRGTKQKIHRFVYRSQICDAVPAVTAETALKYLVKPFCMLKEAQKC